MRALNMQVLTDDTKVRHPGVTVYGIGDEAHKTHSSDHNEDDTPGSKASQSDADNVPEHRAIDIMIGSAFTAAQADAYVSDLLNDPAALARLKYIIWNRHIWEKSNGWNRRDYTGDDPHTNHVHVSGDAADDENGAHWPAVLEGSTNMYCKYGDKGSLNVETLQRRLLRLQAKKKNGSVFTSADVDRSFGDDTKAGLISVIGGAGTNYGPLEIEALDHLYAVRFGSGPGPQGEKGDTGPEGPAGPAGKDGADGKDATYPTTLTITGTAYPATNTSTSGSASAFGGVSAEGGQGAGH